MTFAQTRLLLPKTLPSSRDADSSIASVVMPLMKAIRYRVGLLKVADASAGKASPGGLAGAV